MKKTDNEIISEWRGECRHESGYRASGGYACKKCGEVYTATEYENGVNTDYEQDPAAWDDTLYDEIEKGRLKNAMKNILLHIVRPGDSSWYFIRATAKQKARALAQAIQEKK